MLPNNETIFSEVSGSLIDVIDDLGLLKAFYEVQNVGDYVEQAYKDMIRTSYFNPNGSITGLKNTFVDISHLYDLSPCDLVRLSETDPLLMSNEELEKISEKPYYALFEKKIYYYNSAENPKLIELPIKYEKNPSINSNKDTVINSIFPQDSNVPQLASIENLLELESKLVNKLKNKGELKDPAKPLSWSQGVADGRLFTEFMMKSNNLIEKIEGDNEKDILEAKIKKTQEKNKLSAVEDIGFCFLDDDNKISSFSIAMLRDDSNSEIELDQRKYKLNAVVIHDCTAAAQDRKVTSFCDKSLFTVDLEPRESHANKIDILGKTLFSRIADITNSKKLNELIETIFTEDGSILLPAFRELKQRINSNQNIDNRDVREEQVNQQLELIRANFPDDHPLYIKSYEIKGDPETDINFFKKENFISIFNTISSDINHYTNDPIIQRKNELMTYAIKIEFLGYELPVIKEYCLKTAKILRDTLANFDNHDAQAQASSIIDKYKQGFLTVDEVKQKRDEPVLKTMPTKPTPPQQLRHNFIRRNLGTALLWSVSVLALLGTIAVLAGALAPLGLIVAGTTGLVGATLAAVGAGTLALIAASRISANEKKFGNEVASYKAIYAVYKKTLKDVKDANNISLSSHESSVRQELKTADNIIAKQQEILASLKLQDKPALDTQPELKIVEIIDEEESIGQIDKNLESIHDDLADIASPIKTNSAVVNVTKNKTDKQQETPLFEARSNIV